MPRSTRSTSSHLRRAAFLCAVAFVASACDGTNAGKAGQVAPGSDEALMQQGLDSMYKSLNPIAAEATFREVLRRTPTHYGAHYQLAVALDKGGKPTEARPVWQEVRRLAEAISDTTTLGTARRRLASPDTASPEAMMVLGLDLLFRQANFSAAAAQFRAVLRKNPTHYGATYQLAMSLEKNGQVADARLVWQRMLGMATQINDQKTMQTARDRLK